jgi:rhodanese-related sulfurtransferase/DNA-binding HxlR family transcriptional regulator
MQPTIGTRLAKDDLFNAFASVAASLASGRRLEIIDVLAQAPRTVEDISAAISQSVANTSHHLRRLAEDGLVEAEKAGRHVVYRLASDQVYRLWQVLQDATAEHHPELDDRAGAYLGDRSAIQEIDQETLQKRLKAGDDIVVIDVRPEAEYEAGHLQGAITAPPDRLAEILPQLSASADVVAYCRGHYCSYADQAVRQLQAAGRTAYRLEGGFREWTRS